MSTLADAIGRSFQSEGRGGDMSPMRGLGRRQLTGCEVFAQSVATTAPAASMVIVPTMLLAHGGMVDGLLWLGIVFIATVLAAICVAQFTRRMVSPGGLYSFAYQGLGSRGALVCGVAVLLKYVASASMTLYHGTLAAVTVLTYLGIGDSIATRTVVCLAIAAAMVTALLRSVKVAALAILCIEACSLVFIVGLMVTGEPNGTPGLVESAQSSLPFWLTAVFALAGFESATFLGSEAKRPYVTVTRAVLWTPVVCGALFVVGAWAAISGRADPLVEVYLHGGTASMSPATVVVLQTALTFSWLASALASSNAASRVLFTMGLDGVLPRILGRAHTRFRTPVSGIVVMIALISVSALTMIVLGRWLLMPHLQPASRLGILLGYLVIATAGVLFLRRIGEATLLTYALGGVVGLLSVAALAMLLATGGPSMTIGLLISLSCPALWWLALRRFSPSSLLTIGSFDRADPDDVLPGAATYGPDGTGARVLIADRRPPNPPPARPPTPRS